MIQWMMAISFHGLTHGTFPKRPKCWWENRTYRHGDFSWFHSIFCWEKNVRVRQIKAPCAKKTSPSFHQKLVQELQFHGNSRLNMISPIGCYNPMAHPTRLVFATANSRTVAKRQDLLPSSRPQRQNVGDGFTLWIESWPVSGFIQ